MSSLFSNSFFMGDTMEHNKLCSLRGGPNANFVCRICNCPADMLDVPCTVMTAEDKQAQRVSGKRVSSTTFTLTDAKKIRLSTLTKPEVAVKMGYYPCTENILYELECCDPLGTNISTPPEALHAIQLGHFTRVLNAFAKLERKRNRKRTKRKDK